MNWFILNEYNCTTLRVNIYIFIFAVCTTAIYRRPEICYIDSSRFKIFFLFLYHWRFLHPACLEERWEVTLTQDDQCERVSTLFFCAIKIIFIYGRFSCFKFHYSVQNAATYTVTHYKALILWTILEIFQNKVKFTIIRCQICGSCWDVLQKFWYKGAWLLEAEVDG